jgi:hypothetical protein
MFNLSSLKDTEFSAFVPHSLTAACRSEHPSPEDGSAYLDNQSIYTAIVQGITE